MNGFRPLPIFETLLLPLKKMKVGFTLESEPNLVNESYLVKIIYQPSLVKNQ